ncbi:MAG: DNA/RNA non-specific endonuclease [Ferruginibacter sp.]
MTPLNYLKLLAVSTVILYSCKKNTDDLTPLAVPTVTTSAIAAITGNSAVSGGNIISEGGSPVTARGIIWNAGTSTLNTTVDGTGVGSFTSNISGLAPFTTYFVKAYATNANGTAYGNLVSFKTGSAPPSIPVDNDPLNLGNPTNALPYPSFPDNYLKDNNYYTISYSERRGIPVWVAWHLQREDLGTTSRQDDFRADVNLPGGWYQVQNTSYTGSGFDKGHNCPSADRTLSVQANSSTFLMTNMIPQAPNLNQGPWASLEDFVRNSLVGTTNEAYIVMGNYGTGGYNASGTKVDNIDNGNVTIPAKIWKVVVIMPKGNSDLSRITSATVVLAVAMPNDNRMYTGGSSSDWRTYRTSVAALETEANAAGVPLNLFQRVNDSVVRQALKTKIYP